MKLVMGVITIILLAAALGVVGTLSYEDAVNDENNYCSMVNDGYWPNYKNLDCAAKP